MDKSQLNTNYSDDESLSEMEIALLTQSVDEVDRAESLRSASASIQLSDDEILPPAKKTRSGKQWVTPQFTPTRRGRGRGRGRGGNAAPGRAPLPQTPTPTLTPTPTPTLMQAPIPTPPLPGVTPSNNQENTRPIRPPNPCGQTISRSTVTINNYL